MGRAYKNFWSLNTDEAIVAGILRDGTSKNIEVLMPLNAQMKGIDLVLMNTSKKSITIQVKGSRAFEPRKSEVDEYGKGSPGWFFLSPDVIKKASADYFIFLIYVLEESKETGRRHLRPHTITLPTKKLQELTRKYKKPHPVRYSYVFWINPAKKVARDIKDREYDLSNYLDKKGFVALNKLLK